MGLVEELAKETGRSKTIIYRYINKLGRIPTKEEVLSAKRGRPSKLNSKGELR